jgi:regulator of RNase E activity RraA
MLTSEHLEAIRRFDSCALANAIEIFEVRLKNEGFANSTIRCVFPALPPMLGYAVTGKIRCSSPPIEGHPYVDRTDWWSLIQAMPIPRVIVLEDVDIQPGLGSYVGEVHANILKALDCVGLVTNGSVRDLAAVERIAFPLFSAHTAISHAFAHLVEVGGPVEIGGLRVSPGDLLCGDRHGLLSIPQAIAAQLPSLATRIVENERRVVELCQSPGFTLEKLKEAVKVRV